MNPKVIWGVAAFAVIALFIWGVRSYSNARSAAEAAKAGRENGSSACEHRFPGYGS